MASPPAAFRSLGRGIKRFYALLLVLVLLYVFYMAVAYLIVMVFYPARVPQRLSTWPGHLEAAALRAGGVAGVTAPAARAPFAHYHQVEQWLPLDRVNSCTLSGCHEPLPHSRSIYVRSFANFHSTFLTCEMCHEPVQGQRPVKAGWVSIETGVQTDPPALVQLMRLFQTQRGQLEQDPAGFHQAILAQLAQAVAASADPVLQYLQLEISTSQAGSPVWRDAVDRLDQQVTSHTRGQYGAKIARLATPDEYFRQSEKMRDQAQPFLAAPLNSPDRKRIQDEIHASLQVKPDRCLACHGDSPPLVDFDTLGYPPQRSAFLRTNPVAREVQDLREGRQFYLPSITEEPR
jgi:hypothetical protein